MPYEKCANREQENAIEELKDRVKNELDAQAFLEDDALFYKFLKARNFNVGKAEELLRKHITWRKVYQVDQILDIFQPKEYYIKCIAPNLIGFDKDGDLVRYIAAGRMNSHEVFKSIKMNDAIRHWIWFAENNKELANRTGKKMSLSFIVDLDKLQLENVTSKLSADFMLRLAYTIRENYAERMKTIYVINGPSYFVLLYTIIKAVIPNSLIKKVHIYGCSGWKEKLLELVDADVLPAFLGGKRTDPDGDPYCRSFITLYDKTPEKYYLTEQERYFKDTDEVITLVIPPSEKREVFVQVQKEETTILWKFLVQNKTIRFGLFFQKPPTQEKEIIPLYEYSTADGTEENFYRCISKGKYKIVFDNSHSRFSSKEVQYCISVEKTTIQE